MSFIARVPVTVASGTSSFVAPSRVTSAVTSASAQLVLRLCRSRARAGDAVVVVVHDLGLAAAYADRVALLRAGRVAAEGPPAEVFSERLLSDVYDQPVEVFPHPRTDALLITPRRDL